MSTNSLTISLSESLRAFVDRQVAEGNHGTAEGYLEFLLREAQRRRAEEKLERLLLEGLEGEGTVVTKEWWDDFRARLLERHRKVRKG